MAFSLVQTTNVVDLTGGASTIVIPISSTIQGNLVVVHIAYSNKSGGAVSSVTDNQGNTYDSSITKDHTSTSDSACQAYGVQITGGVTSITVTFNAADVGIQAGADEYAGGKKTNATVFDKYGTNDGTGTSQSVGALSPANGSGELIVATLSNGFGGTTPTITAGTSYTESVTGTTSPGGKPFVWGEYRLDSTSSETAPASSSVSMSWAEIAVMYFPQPYDTVWFVINGD